MQPFSTKLPKLVYEYNNDAFVKIYHPREIEDLITLDQNWESLNLPEEQRKKMTLRLSKGVVSFPDELTWLHRKQIIEAYQK